ncbi:hypothetical protein SDC9_181958 [bioreactor metagenome]|uniref:CMP/dCMP-type deaminase domain-containing protein n=2 Tax=root TaxID=1 RepID=A0A645H658_9ZZZZ
MIGSTMYLVGKEERTGKFVENASPCSLCKRFIINSGIDKVVIRDTKEEFREILVNQWIDNDDSLAGDGSY